MDPKLFPPEPRSVLHIEQFVNRGKLLNLLRILRRREQQDKACLIDPQVEELQEGGIRHHITIIIVCKTIQAVDVRPGADPVAEQLRLVRHMGPFKQIHRVIRRKAFFLKWNRTVSQRLHLRLNLVEQFLAQLHIITLEGTEPQTGSTHAHFSRAARYEMPSASAGTGCAYRYPFLPYPPW